MGGGLGVRSTAVYQADTDTALYAYYASFAKDSTERLRDDAQK